jgi:hypothetical protein
MSVLRSGTERRLKANAYVLFTMTTIFGMNVIISECVVYHPRLRASPHAVVEIVAKVCVVCTVPEGGGWVKREGGGGGEAWQLLSLCSASMFKEALICHAAQGYSKQQTISSETAAHKTGRAEF